MPIKVLEAFPETHIRLKVKFLRWPGIVVKAWKLKLACLGLNPASTTYSLNQTTFLTSQRLSFLICKMGMITALPYWIVN